MTLDLTIVIPTKNDGKNLKRCLAAIGRNFAFQVVVVDSGSQDETTRIAADHGADFVLFDWNGQFPKKRNWLLRNYPPSTKWVLFLDADECLTPAFKEELQIALPTTNHVGFWLHYTIHFLGKELRYGYPLDKLALFRVGAGEYERIDEQQWSQLDMEIHEHPVLQGSIGTIHSKIDHRDFRSIHHYISKHNEYSSWEAKRFLSHQRTTNLNQLTLKQKVKYRVVTSPFAGIIYFLGAYVIMRGFLDGTRGFVFAILKMGYFTQVYCKIRELKQQQA